MKFLETDFKNCFLIDIDKEIDHRGFFARVWDKKIFTSHNINTNLSQCSISANKKIGTLRGIHYQTYPHEEDKLVRCTRGRIFDVVVDLRPNSKTYKKWMGVELSEENYRMIYIPKGIAHGFQTLEDNTEVFYQISDEYMPNYSKGIRWNDPAFHIEWPIDSPIMSQRDKEYPNFEKSMEVF